MSDVTNLILIIPLNEEEKTKIQEVNTFFNDRGLVSCDDELLPIGWYGGSKMLETNIYIGAFNNLNLKKFKEHLKKISWYEKELVQLIVKEQDEDKFRIEKII